MRGFEASSFIDAPPERVWPLLADTAAWPGWDSGVTKVEGTPVVGGKITIMFAASAERSASSGSIADSAEGSASSGGIAASPAKAFPLTVSALEAPNRMVLRGGLPLGLFTGRRAYTLVPEGGGTRFTMREEFTGPLAGLIFRTIPALDPSFRQFAEGLKKRAEQGRPDQAPL